VGGIGLLIGSIGLILRGAFAGFTSVANGSNADNSADMVLSLPTAGTTNRISVAYPNIRPGGTVYRRFDLTAGGGLGAITMNTVAATTSLLDSDATNGLQMQIDKCSGSTQPDGGWLEAGSTPDYTYSCPSGTTAPVVTTRSIIGSKVAVSNVSSGATNHLLLTVTLPTSSPTTMQSANSVIQYKFQADQRAAGPQ